ncbi:MAG: sigma-70 family RNA polymerase sigma factor [Candidatus Latescibacterota bacterium]|nr:MAG: sigma-70 family RNA polymerase sigma factor [Candidatus Latescibacterota bacterium]
MTTDRDEIIVEACLAGDRKVFEVLVERYEKKLYNAAYRILGESEDAMDATQSAFVKAFEKLHTFNPTLRFFPWMYRILINESLNIVAQRRRFEELDSNIEMPGRSPEQRFSDRELGRQLQAAMMDLKPDQRVVVALRHYQGFTYKEIGQVLNLPEKTVKSRLFTARRQLREILQRKGIVA